MHPLDNVSWLYDTSLKNVLKHLLAGALATVFLFAWLSTVGTPVSRRGFGALIAIACIAVYGWIWGCVLLIFKLRS